MAGTIVRMRARSHPPGVMGKIRHSELGIPLGSAGERS
jgi:hypothetical protein